MKLQIESTHRKVNVGGTECRVWNGRTPRGTECRALIALIALPTQAEQNEFAADLEEQPSSPLLEQAEHHLLDQAERDAGVVPFASGRAPLTGFLPTLDLLVVTRGSEVRGYYFHPDPAVMDAKERELTAGAAALGWIVSRGTYRLDANTLAHVFTTRL